MQLTKAVTLACLLACMLAPALVWALPVADDRPCPTPAIPNRRHCLCPPTAPVCKGSKCVTGQQKSTGGLVQGFHQDCKDCACVVGDVNKDGGGSLVSKRAAPTLPTTIQVLVNKQDPAYWERQILNNPKVQPNKPRVLIMTVATHREPFIELVEQSVSDLGLKLHVAGIGGYFKGYGWKLKRVRETLEEFKDDYDIVIFTDSFDSYIFANIDEIIAKFRSFKAPMVVSGEVNCWPNPHLAPFMPPSSKTGHYPFPNSGGYIGYLGYILHLYTDVIAIHHKSDCCDDQGELIKAVVLDHGAFKIDHNAVIFQTLFGSAKEDVIVRNSRPFNTATGTQPCIVHANGWDKGPLLELLRDCNKLSAAQVRELIETKAKLDKQKILSKRESDINDRCKLHNPNPSLEPERNFIEEYGLLPKLPVLADQLKKQPNVSWHQIEQQIYEVQEYRSFCPALPLHFQESNHGSLSSDRPSSLLQDRTCSKFKVYLYPLNPEAESRLAPIYREVRRIIAEGPYATTDPAEACVFVPSVDVSCWCENCLFGAYSNNIEQMHPRSYDTQIALQKLAFWDEGRNHILFEFSDAPCISFYADYAIVAKVGLSDFHHRTGLDVSMPLFSMVEFSASDRRRPISQRHFLLTFRGTRSQRSDAMRNHLPQLHNGKDIILVCACRWYGAKDENGNMIGGYDPDCENAEKEFKKHTYTELGMYTKFALIVEGFGYHSFRLTEVMAAGAIPVIIIDHYTLPYNDLLDWDEFSVRVPEHRMLEIPDILAKISDEKRQQMQERVVFVYENFFRSLGYQVHAALESVRVNLFTSDDRKRAEEKAKISKNGFPYKLPPNQSVTSQQVLKDSVSCNTPPHRRKEAKDNAPML